MKKEKETIIEVCEVKMQRRREEKTGEIDRGIIEEI
jgi:hypothetical protein